jgi:hypothetical protein
MTKKDANIVAVLLRRTHGGEVDKFIRDQIRRFQSEAKGGVALAAWEMVNLEVERLRAAEPVR